MEKTDPTPPRCSCGEQSEFAVYSGTSGNNIVAWCAACWRPVNVNGRPFYARHAFRDSTYAEMPALSDWNMSRCPSCGKKAHLEQHHWAPKSIFGVEADNHPVTDMCRACHERIHKMMGIPIGEHRKADNGTRRVLQPCGSPIEQLALRSEA